MTILHLLGHSSKEDIYELLMLLEVFTVEFEIIGEGRIFQETQARVDMRTLTLFHS